MKKINKLIIVMLLAVLVAGCGKKESVNVRVGSLKGATSLGLLDLMDRAKNDACDNKYEFTMATGADEILPLMVKGELDIALIPANAAANLYQKSDKAIEVIDINTLGVLYLLTGDTEIKTIQDLTGKTIYLTGKGTTPEATLRCILKENGITEDGYTLEFKSEPTEVVSMLAENPEAIALLPQPFATAACIQNENLQYITALNDEWNKLFESEGTMLVTGVTVVRKAFADEHPEVVRSFLEDHKKSVESVNNDVDRAATLAVESGIIAKEPIAKKALPLCSIVYIDGSDMKKALVGYIEKLYDFNPELVGNALPEDDFYFEQK